MRKQVLFTTMLSLAMTGGLSTYVTPVMATVTQSKTIKAKGTVVDENGEPLIGASVTVKGAKGGTITDIDGNFVIDAPASGTLVVSYVGYEPREFAVNNRTELGELKLTSDQTQLEQVVVVGYGTQKKADLTGSVSIVNAEELKRVSNSNISSMLEGKVAGVQITSDGQPGADPTVRIRGIGSFGDTSPLYVIDGVPMGTTIRDFSPNDIETIQVLKDASAGAIYGSRAANGVVIITTKGGKKEQPLKVDYKGYFGFDKIPSGVYDVMDADQYSNHLATAIKNSGSVIPNGYSMGADGRYHFQDATNTDWFKETFTVGTRMNHNINMSGGGKNNTYNVGLDYYKQKGTLEGAGPNYQRFTARVNNTFDTKFIKFRTSVVYSHSDQDNMSQSNTDVQYIEGMYSGLQPILQSIVTMPPTIKAYDESTWCLDSRYPGAKNYTYDAYGYGVYYTDVHGDLGLLNPLLLNQKLTRNTIVDRFVGTASADVDIFKMLGQEFKNHKLTYKLNLSYSTTSASDKTFIGAWFQSNRVSMSKTSEKLTKVKRTHNDFLVENTLTYEGTIGLNHINLLAGITYEEDNHSWLTGTGTNMTEPYYLQVQHGASRDANSREEKHAITSLIGRLNYDYDSKYLLSFTVRRDGSSRLTKDIRWGTFPSVSVGWRFDKEKFFPIPHNIVNMFKIRASYGELGNENIGNYVYMSTLTPDLMTYNFGNTVVSGTSVENFVNSEIAWEKKKSTNIGIDLALFNNRLEFTAEWYMNKSVDLLTSVAVPANAGFRNTAVTMNAASMTNSGFEFSATYRNSDHPLKWQVSGNLSTLRNRVTDLGRGIQKRLDGDHITMTGQEIGQFYGFVFERIARTQTDLDDHATQAGAKIGDCLYKDTNNDGVINDDDRVVLGSALPKVNFGLSARLEYKGFDLAISTYGTFKHHVSDVIYNVINASDGWGNKDVKLLEANRWSADGTTYLSDTPRTFLTGSGEIWNNRFSDRMIQNAAYWKIANIELGYNFPDKWFKGIVSGVRVYTSVQNLHTFTSYKGYNVDYAGGTFTPGTNYCSYPNARTFMFGMLFSF